MSLPFEQQEGLPYQNYPQLGTSQEVHLFRLSNEDLLEYMDNQLRGYALVSDGNSKKWVKKYRAWANDEGISRIMSILTGLGLNKNITLGNLKETQIDQRCLNIWHNLAFLLTVKYYRYGIDKSSRALLVQFVVQQIHSALSRSWLGREGRQLSSTTQHLEHTVREDKPRGLFNFNPARKMSQREI